MQAEAAVLAKLCVKAEWDEVDGRSLLELLLSLCDDLLHAVLRICGAELGPQQCFIRLPFGLHRQFLAAQEICEAGEQRLCLAVPVHERRIDPAKRVRAVPFSIAACMALCAQLPQLRSLTSADLSGSLRGEQQFAGAVQALACCSQLRRLRIARCVSGNVGMHALAQSMQHWRLQQLDLSGMSAGCIMHPQDGMPHGDIVFSTLQKQTALTELSLRGMPLTQQLAAAIVQLTELRSLDIAQGDVVVSDSPLLADGPYVRLSTLHQLTQLDIRNCQLQQTAAPFAACTRLRVLSLSRTQGTTAACASWSALRSLECLIIDEPGLAHAAVESVSQLQCQTELVLHGSTHVRPQDCRRILNALGGMHALRVVRATDAQTHLSQAWPGMPLLSELHFNVHEGETLLNAGRVPLGDVMPLTALQQLDVTLQWGANEEPDIDDDEVDVAQMMSRAALHFRWLPIELSRLTNLTALHLQHSNSVDLEHVPYCDWLMGRAGTALAHLLELRVGGADLRSCEDASELPCTLASLTLLELRGAD